MGTAHGVRASIESSGVSSAYTLAFSMRCGSTVLCNLLSRLGVGAPTEYFRYPYEGNESFATAGAARVAEALSALARTHAVGGIFGSKMSHDHRAHLDARLRAELSGYASVADVLPAHKWMFMRRRDVIGQALSLHVAQSRDQWHVPAEGGALVDREVPYDFFAILSRLMILEANNASWEAYFEAAAIRPHRIWYEDLVADPSGQLGAILAFLGVEREVPAQVTLEGEGGLVRIAQAAKQTYRALRERFTDDLVRLGEPGDAERLGSEALMRWSDFFAQQGWRAPRSFTEGRVVWLTGLPAAGKSTLARALERELRGAGRMACVLDGDAVRAGLSRDLGFGAGDRSENVRRVAEVARLMAGAGIVVIAALVSPFRRDRAIARAVVGAERFTEVYVNTPLEVCEQRDPKGMYLRARQGLLPEMTGVGSPYEAPEAPDFVADGGGELQDEVRALLSRL